MLNFSTRAVKNIDLFFLSDFTDMLSITQGCSRTLERNSPWSKELRILVKSKGQFYIKLHLPEYLVKQYCLQKCCKNLCLSFSYFTSLCQFIFFLHYCLYLILYIFSHLYRIKLCSSFILTAKKPISSYNKTNNFYLKKSKMSFTLLSFFPQMITKSNPDGVQVL